MAALDKYRDPVKGGRQGAAPSAAALDLQTMAVAHYANTDHDSAAGRLIQGQVDHTLVIGKRCHTTPEELAAMERDFCNAPDALGDTLFQLGTCPVCQRKVSHGEFGVDHLMYYLEGDVDRKPQKVRSLPRIWCTPCAKQRAKRQRRPYARSRDDVSFNDAWAAFVKQVRAEQGGGGAAAEAAPAAAAPEAVPANEPTRRLWAWLAKTLPTATFHKEGKIAFKVLDAAPLAGSDVDLENKRFEITLRVAYEATTALVSGEAVEARGASVVSLALATGAAAVATAVVANERCTLTNEPDAAVLERCMLKTDLIAKVWAKKGVPRFVFNKLGDLKPHADKLMA